MQSIEQFVDPKIEANLSEKYDGKLFVHIFVTHFSGRYFIHKEYYTVKDGKTYIVSNGQFYASGDSMFQISLHCKMVGVYDKKKTYKKIVKDYTYAAFKKLHKL